MTTSTDDDAVQPLALPSPAPPMRVLAAEDNPVFQSMLKTMLTKWGYQAIVARSGTEAWRILANRSPWSWPTSTASSRSTTATDIWRATPCSAKPLTA